MMPTAKNLIAKHLRERLVDAEEDAKESHRIAMNSYGAGYDRGYAVAIRATIADITGEE